MSLAQASRFRSAWMAVQLVVFGGVILYFSQSVLVPLAYSTLLACVLYPVCIWFEKKGFSRAAAIGFSVGLVTLVLLAFVVIVVALVVNFADEWPALQGRLVTSIRNISSIIAENLGISPEEQGAYWSKATDQALGSAWGVFKGAISVSATSAVMAILIPVYTCLILFYRRQWLSVLGLMFPKLGLERVRTIAALTIDTYYNFIKGMLVVYVAVGVLNSIGLFLLGVPHALLFGFLTSILTIIPYIGIMIGSLLPVAMAWAAHDSIWYPLGVIGVFAFVQYLEANVIFPFAVSSRLKVNTLVVLLAIFVGGIVWGVSGMILFVPFVGILKLIADQVPGMKAVSAFLGMDEPPGPPALEQVLESQQSK